MEVDTIVTEVQSILQDETYTSTWIVGKFNEVLITVATMCRIPGLQLTVPLPVLAAETSITMPKTFLHGLYMVTTATYPGGLLIAPNAKEMIVSAGQGTIETGHIAVVALDGRTLSFRPIPEEAESLVCSYYCKPKELFAGDYFPDYIPEILHKDIFQNYALKEAYNQLEDGIDGSMPNTQKYSALTLAGIQGLVSFYPNAPKARADVRRNLVWF